MDFTQDQQDFIARIVNQANQGLVAGQNQENQVNQNVGNRNGARLPHVRNISCTNYGPKGDFDQWVSIFKDNVRASHGMQPGDAGLNAQYVNWITTKLEPSARAVFDSLTPEIRGDWTQLEPTLSEAFTDEHEKLEFLSRMDSFQRAPNMTLREYKNELQRRMYKYQPLLREVPAEFNRSAVQRFREGIKDLALAAHLMMNCKGDRETLEHALEAAISWETTFKHFVHKDQEDAIQNGAKALMGTMFGIPHMTMSPMEAPKGPDPISDLRTKVKEHELSIAELKAGQALTNDRIDSMEKTVRDDIQKLTKAVNVGFANTNPRQQFNPQNSQPQVFTRPYTDPQNFQSQAPRPQAPRNYQSQAFRPQSPQNFMPRPQRQRHPIIPGPTGGPGFIDNKPRQSTCNSARPLAPMEMGLNNPEQAVQPEPEIQYFPNPLTEGLPQIGAFDMGSGWTQMGDYGNAETQNYDTNPTGTYSYGNQYGSF